MKPTPTPDLLKAAVEAVWKYSLVIESSVRRGDGPDQYAGVVEALQLVKDARAALSVPAAAVVGEPVAWTTQAQIDKFKVDPGCNAVMWGEPLPHHPDIPLYAAHSAPDGWQRIDSAPKHQNVLVWREDAGEPWVAQFTDATFYDAENGDPDDEAWFDLAGRYEGVEAPTHWRPLPAPPALGGASHE